MEQLKLELKSHLQKCLLNSDFKLSAGSKSNFYFDVKKASLNGKFLSQFSEYILDIVLPQYQLTPHVVGGLTLGADFLTAALVLKSYEKKKSIEQGSIVRKEPKKHGTQNLIENDLNETPNANKDILVIEDVITSGKSIEKATEVFKAAGYHIIGLLTIIDREVGGEEYLKTKYSVPILSLFKASEFSLNSK